MVSMSSRRNGLGELLVLERELECRPLLIGLELASVPKWY